MYYIILTQAAKICLKTWDDSIDNVEAMMSWDSQKQVMRN
jgi:hypothetical protein